MILGVTGSRVITDRKYIYDYLDKYSRINKITEVVSGKAKGPDTIGEEWAISRGYPFTPFPPIKEEIDLYGKKAFFLRNERMADYCHKAVIFWDGKSSGTSNMMYNMRKRNKDYQVIVYRLENKQDFFNPED